MTAPLPYKIAVLCYLFNEQGQTLLLHRIKPPNKHLYSPIGGKLEQAVGESPTHCAAREIFEEAGVTVEHKDLHLTGIVSESGFQGSAHWLMFLYEVTRPVTVIPTSFHEGTLEWYSREQIDALPIPDSDRLVIWPLFWQYRRSFFCAHLDCQGDKIVQWRIEQPRLDVRTVKG